MMESIEIHSYPIKSNTDDDIQEYHEIIIEETSFLNTKASSSEMFKNPRHINEYDFFTKINVKTPNTNIKSTKKSKKKAKIENLITLIDSEIAAVTPSLTENIITKINFNQRSLFENNNVVQQIFGRRPLYKAELGQKPRVDLSPIFPKVLENAIRNVNEIQVEYVEPTMYNDIIKSCKNTCPNDTTIFLDITLKNLKFLHHHKFSLEKLLTTELAKLYTEYKNVNRTIIHLATDIKVIRETKNNLKEDLIKINPDKENNICFDPIIRKYTRKLLHLKEMYMKALKSRKLIIHKIESLWSDVEMIRIKSKCLLTNSILIINERKCSKDEGENQWIDLFNTEFTDALDKIEYDYVSKYTEYKETKQKLQNTPKIKIIKPKLIIDEANVNEKVERIVNDIISNEKIELVFKKDENMPTDLLKFETPRTMYCFEIYVDDIFVCESEQYTDERKFHIDFDEIFSIQILPNNNTLTVVLIENEERVSQVKINLTDVRKKNNNNMKENFFYDVTVKPTSKCVGSGITIKEIASATKVKLKSCSLFKNTLNTVGEIFIQMKWNVKSSENYKEELKSFIESGRKIKRTLQGFDKPTIDIIKDLIIDLYGKDVTEDEIMFNKLKDLCKSEIKIDNTFSIDENSAEFVRFKLLHLRNNGGFANVEDKMIPLNANQISIKQLNCIEKSDIKDFDLDYLNEMDPIEIQRYIGVKYIERLNKNILKIFNDVLVKKTYKDVVRDFSDLTLRSLLTRRNNFTLESLSNVTKQQILNESLDKPQEIQLTVVRAFNLLDRSASELQDEDSINEIAGFKMHPLRPFVRVSYRGVSAHTVTGMGCHPTWNQTLKINTKLNPLSSLHINIYDEFKENITEGFSDNENSNRTVQYKYYDKWLGTLEVPLYNVLALGVLRGTFKITTPPVTFGYENSQAKLSNSRVPEINQLLKKDTSFIALHITTSLSHLGGLQQYNQPINTNEDDLIKHLNSFVTRFNNDFPFRSISLTFIDSGGNNRCVTEFLQPIPFPNQNHFPKNPKICESAVSKSSGLSRSSSSKSSERKEIDLEKGRVVDDRESIYSAGRSGNDVIFKMVHVCMRYVALIPSYEITESHFITLSGTELLKILQGSPIDHSILLASYFLHLGIKFWIVIGLGLPRGRSSYVLIKYDLGINKLVQIHDRERKGFFCKNDGYLWYVFDAISGEKFELREVGCPLKTVDYVFDSDNIWVNVQSSQDRDNMSFDFSKSSDWQQVFAKPLFMPKPILIENSLYSDPCDVEDLRQMLESKIKAKVQKWRSHVKTIWNRYYGSLLRESLPHWEYWAFNSMEQKPEPNQKLKQLMLTHKMFGFPLNMPFTNTKAVVSRVKSTNLHHNDDPNVEFGVAVDLYSYPNNVVSVWIYLASVTTI